MSKLNPNAGAWTPSFTPKVTTTTSTGVTRGSTVEPMMKGKLASPVVDSNTSLSASSKAEDEITSIDKSDTDMTLPPTSKPYSYSIEFLRQFQSICDTIPCVFPDVVRAPPPPRLGRMTNGRLTYSIQELMLFQPLYTRMPLDLTWTETIVSDVAEHKCGKLSKKEKAKLRAFDAQQLHYDPALQSYFNPTEYAAALNISIYNSSNTTSAPAAIAPVVCVNADEATLAIKQLSGLLETVSAETVESILKSFEEIQISCIQTLQDVVGLLFDTAIAQPLLCDPFALLCSGIAERTSEFKEGAKTINFRRVLLTKCYEALIEEPEVASPPSDASISTTENPPLHSWRRQRMLENVCFLGELFRRQLLTENIMHVCVAMMLEEEVKPQMEIIDAACRLLALVGDLLDGSSPASRRTMDEYFDVLNRLREHVDTPQVLQESITDISALRATGWAKKRLEGISSSAPSPILKSIQEVVKLVSNTVDVNSDTRIESTLPS